MDRRIFLERMGALTAAVAAGGLGAPTRASALAVPAVSDVSLPSAAAVQATDPREMTVAELASLIRDRELSPVELVEGYLERIEAHEQVLMAFNTVTGEAALEAARRLEAEPWSGPLHGIPLAIKDNYFTAGVPTTANSHIFRDFVPEFDGTAWARLRASGGILLGKTQMGPLATSRATTPDGEETTTNAWAPLDDSLSPGGSSSGSATAVAARLAASSTGTQTGGSITGPSEAQGLTGLKPTMGRVSLYGIIPLTYTRDHPGPLARDARDAALMLQAMAGPDPADPRTLGLPPVPDYVAASQPVSRGGSVGLRWPTRIGVPPGYLDAPEPPSFSPDFPERQESDQARARRLALRQARQEAELAARREMLATLESVGADIVEISLPDDWETLTSRDFNNVRLPERAEPFLEHLRRDVRLFGVSLSPWINGLLLAGPEYLRGQRAKMLLLERVLDDIFGQCDVVLQTSSIPFDMIGLPLVTVPIGFEESAGSARPMGALFGAGPFGEERLLSVAAGYQAVTSWHTRRPPDPPAPDEEARSQAPRPRHRLDVLDVWAECE